MGRGGDNYALIMGLELFLSTYLAPIGSFFLNLWWLWLFIILVILAHETWLAAAQEHFKIGSKPLLFELHFPREVKRTPRAMEQIFMTFHTMRNIPDNVEEKYWDGEVTLYFSFEVASFGGDIHFYFRGPAKYRNVFESVFYAHYPDLEITQLNEDYLDRLPRTVEDIYERGEKIFANQFILSKPDVYPIRTYFSFETPQEEGQLDPIAALLELLVKVDPRETICLQLIVRPVGNEWKKVGDELVYQLKEGARKPREGKAGELIFVAISPGEKEVMEAVERNIAKPGFETMIRYFYISPRELFNDSFARRGMLSVFNQYASENLNRFRHNELVYTKQNMWSFPYLYPRLRVRDRARRIYTNFRLRHIPDENYAAALLSIRTWHWGLRSEWTERIILNAEELATIYHPPTFLVMTGPIIKRVPSTKMGPPAGLPIYGEGGETPDLPIQK